MAEIRIENLSKVFGSKPEKALELLHQGYSKQEILEQTGHNVGVANANLTIAEGGIFVVMGLSGSGKSTILRMINRLIQPTEGHIYIDGEDITKMNPQELRDVRQRKMSMVFQNFGLFPHRTVLDNVKYPLTIRGVDDTESTNKAETAIETVGLKGYEQSYPDQLSGGMQQRVGLARALAGDANVLLMDEAFSALDPLIRKDMQDELLELQELMRKTIVFITHDLNEALKLGDQIAIMRDGKVIQVGAPEEILTNPADEYVERFIEDATISRVFTVRQIAREPYAILHNRGPRVALQLMKRHGVSDLFVVNPKREVLGLVSAEEMRYAVDHQKTIVDMMEKEVPQVSPNDTLEDAITVAASTSRPVAVVENGRLVGAAVKGAILAGMSGELENHLEDVGDTSAVEDSLVETPLINGDTAVAETIEGGGQDE